MVIDFHTHIFPEKIEKKAIKVLEENIYKNTGEYGRAVIAATADALVDSMDKSGIDYSVVLPIATTVTQSETINSYAQIINQKERLFSLGSVHPLQDDWESALYNIKEKNLRGIKLHPEYQGFYIDSPESVNILKKCRDLSLIVVVHAGVDIGAAPPVHCPPDRILNALKKAEGVKLVAAHLGGWEMWDDVEKYLVGTDVFLDTSFIFDYIEREQLLRIIRNHGSEKILFGTDSPWAAQKSTLDYIKSLNLTDSQQENILSGNAKKLLGI